MESDERVKLTLHNSHSLKFKCEPYCCCFVFFNLSWTRAIQEWQSGRCYYKTKSPTYLNFPSWEKHTLFFADVMKRQVLQNIVATGNISGRGWLRQNDAERFKVVAWRNIMYRTHPKHQWPIRGDTCQPMSYSYVKCKCHIPMSYAYVILLCHMPVAYGYTMMLKDNGTCELCLLVQLY